MREGAAGVGRAQAQALSPAVTDAPSSSEHGRVGVTVRLIGGVPHVPFRLSCPVNGEAVGFWAPLRSGPFLVSCAVCAQEHLVEWRHASLQANIYHVGSKGWAERMPLEAKDFVRLTGGQER